MVSNFGVYCASNLVAYFIRYSSYYYSCGSIQGSDVFSKDRVVVGEFCEGP